MARHSLRLSLYLSLRLSLFLSLWLANGALAQTPSRIQFRNVSEACGIDFVHRDGSSGGYYLVEAIAGSMASADFDRDGRIDLFFLNGAALKGTEYPKRPVNQLFRNLGNFSFADVSIPAEVNDPDYALGVTVGDYDNDGFEDLYVTNMGPNVLYHNNGDGTFSPQHSLALDCGDKVGAGACMLDLEADGDLDIYAASYITFSYDIPPSEFRGRVVYGGPLLYPKESDNLLKNNGRGGFDDISQQAGIAEESEWGMGTICVDFDRDGDTDVFVANDSTKNFLWLNDGTGTFTETALFSGVAYDFQGDPQGSMGVDAADLNGDQWLDLFQTAYTKQLATLYRNDQGVLFEDATRATGIGKGTFHPVNWGTGLGDFDNDADSDLFVANGHIHDNMDDVNPAKYKIRNFLFENLAGRRFQEIGETAGTGLEPVESSRGCVLDDLNNDGLLDIVVQNSRTTPSVLKNVSDTDMHWVQLEFIGITCNRSGVGSQVTLTTAQGSQTREVHSGRGYQGHFGSRLHFGLGDEESIESIEIQWLGGETQTLLNLDSNTRYIIRQDQPAVADHAVGPIH